MPNRSRIVLTLSDAAGRPISDSIRIELRNQRLSSLNQRFDLSAFTGKATLKNVPAVPDGLAELSIIPERYLFKARFVNVPAGADCIVDETLFIDSGKANPSFPTFTALPPDVRGLWKRSGLSAGDWKERDALEKAGLLNICAKARAIEISPGRTVTDCFQKLHAVEFERSEPERIYVLVDADLHTLVSARKDFRSVSGGLHRFPDGWQMLPSDESFKTLDAAGNLQLTFARDTSSEGLWLVDADIDDHAGVRHAFDVLGHLITGKDTHPYNIHQILRFLQQIDPGYDLT